MAVWTYPVSNEHNVYPNLTVRESRRDGELRGWRVNPNEGYVFYDTTEELHIEIIDPETMEHRFVRWYYTEADLPLAYNWDEFQFVAVPRDSVDENHIHGGGDNEHEVM